MDKRVIENKLMDIGIPPNLKGFSYICDAVEKLAKNDGMKMMELYEFISEKDEITPSRVERGIRYAIQKIDLNALNDFPVLGLRNSEFIYSMVFLLRREEDE